MNKQYFSGGIMMHSIYKAGKFSGNHYTMYSLDLA